MGLGTNLKKILKERNMTIKELSKLSGISINTLYSITKRDSNMARYDIVKKISNVLNISVEELAGFKIDESQADPKTARLYEMIKRDKQNQKENSDSFDANTMRVIINENIKDIDLSKLKKLVTQIIEDSLSELEKEPQFQYISSKSNSSTPNYIQLKMKKAIFDNYDHLNPEGQKRLFEYSDDLVENKKYCKDSDTPELNAAHARTDIDIPEGADTSDNDIMDDKNF